jgi:hypothetical protein
MNEMSTKLSLLKKKSHQIIVSITLEEGFLDRFLITIYLKLFFWIFLITFTIIT